MGGPLTTSALLAATLIALVVAGAVVRRQFEGFFFELEDARPIALFRFVLAALLLLHVHGLSPWFELLFAPTGMFTPSEARATFAAGDALVRPFSLLYFDVPFELVLVLFDVAAVLLLVGLFSRTSAIATLVLFDTILARNLVFWEGGDVVLRVWLVYLACARSGHAWSIDAWLHRRRTGTASRPIPAWPRRLMTIQLALLLVTTGLLKHGGAWLDGDAAYLAMTSELYARFDLADEIAALGDGPNTAMTWIARTIEVGFPLALVGIVGRWAATRGEPLRGRERLVFVTAMLVAAVCSTAIVVLTGAPRLLPIASTPIAVASWVGVLVLVAWKWPALRRGTVGIFDRRLWVGAAAVLMLGLWASMNIGQFHPAMLATLIPVLALERRDPAPLAYSPRARAIGSIAIAWHLVALLVAAIPEAPSTSVVRGVLRTVTRPWLALTRTSQSWGMWADPPRHTVFLRVVIVDDDGVSQELRDDLYADERRHRSVWFYDRWWKIAGRIANARDASPYPAAFARWTCRQHPQARAVELWTTTVPIPTAAQRRDGVSVQPLPPQLRSTTACP